ncbi:DUF1501 domain-containing protein [Cochlodiniinecator piscidefendens]|uniref:DUF1501 domain-containing protein n=1 Tax=Cochlodiniinecator piscidefendens TaxID=2715756 RepID=UPI0014080F1B|nr:DUF1501 domain-containing protein [Cochlodiniinecator piscidefendens]
MVVSRRKFLTRAAGYGCSLAASPLITPITFASAPGDVRLVVIILRGGMDGLDMVRPYGDPNLRALRPTLAASASVDLDGFFGLHEAASPLMPLWQSGELGFAHAVSTPYRDKRSHFDGQDLLEAGTGSSLGQGGWLNRLLQRMPGARAQTGFSIGAEAMLVMSGNAPVSNWSPETELRLSEPSRRLLEVVYHDDPVFRDALDEAMDLTQIMNRDAVADSYAEALNTMESMVEGSRGGDGHLRLAQFAAERLRAETRIAAFSLSGWDTHQNQARGMRRNTTQLTDVILTLREGLGADWSKTAVLAMTEFGRTARENGTRGTDHGTGGLMFMAGGAVRGGQVYGGWPGLDEGALYQGRDLMPTTDIRAYAGQVISGLFGLERSQIESSIFPGVDLTTAPGVIA